MLILLLRLLVLRLMLLLLLRLIGAARGNGDHTQRCVGGVSRDSEVVAVVARDTPLHADY